MTTKRNWFIGLTVTMLGLFGMSGIAAAATTPQVSGTITMNGAAAVNATVTAVCTATGGAHTRNVTTSSTGHYSVSFAAGQCDDGSQVAITATSSDGTSSGQSSGVMGAGGTAQRIIIDCELAASVPLPEFVPVAAMLALMIAGGTIMYIRHRKIRDASFNT